MGNDMIATYKASYLASLYQNDLYAFMNSAADDCLRKIAGDPEVTPMVMNAALQTLRMRRHVELHCYEWECHTKRYEATQSLFVQNTLPRPEFGKI